MEDSRVGVALTANAFTNIYTALSVAVGTKLAIQNQSSDPIVVCIASTAAENKGFVVDIGEYLIVPAGSSGCFVKTVTNESGVVSVQLGGYAIPNSPIDERIYSGTRSFSTQNIVEANCKNGTQFEFTTFTAAIPAGTSREFVVITGAKPVVIKNRVFTFTGTQLTTTIFRSPTYTGGTPTSYFNMNDWTPATGLSQILALPTVTSAGTQIAPTIVLLGSQPQGGNAITTSTAESGVSGLERVLRPNTTYLFRSTNSGVGNSDVTSKTTWYEGDLPNSLY